MAPRPPSKSEIIRNMALALVETSTAPLLLLDANLSVIAASASFCAAFQIEPAQTAGHPLVELGAGEWNVPQLSSLLRATASGYAEVVGYEMNLVREGRAARHLVLNAKKLTYVGEDSVQIILSVADETAARLAEKLREDLLREKDVLVQELHHRVANSLQIIASVLMQSARRVQSEETRSHLYDAHQRVMSVAALQRQLAVSRLGDVELRPYLKALCESIGASMIRDHRQLILSVRADDSITTADTSVSLGLIVTELVINALKHAFPGNRAGRILVDYQAHGPDWILSVGDDGIGMAEHPDSAKPGLGTSIIQALTAQLGATINISDTNPGTRISIGYSHMLVGQTAAAATQAV